MGARSAPKPEELSGVTLAERIANHVATKTPQHLGHLQATTSHAARDD